MNKYIKKIISMFLILSVLIPSAAYAYVPSIDDVPVRGDKTENGVSGDSITGTSTEMTYELLSYIEIITQGKEELDADENATKAMAAEWFSRIVNTNSYGERELPYTDVSTGTKYYEGIVRAYETGIIKAANAFEPTAKVSAEDVAEMAMYSVGYEKMYQDGNAMAFADDNDIFKNVKIKDGALTVAGLMKAVENTLLTKKLDYSIQTEGNYSITINENVTYLRDKKDITIQRGIITGVDYSSIYPESGSDLGYIEINRGRFLYDGKLSVDMVGKYLEAYVDASDEKRVIAFHTDKNEVFEVAGDDLELIDQTDIQYHNEKKLIKKTVSDDAKVLFNDIYFGTVEQAVNASKFTKCDKLVLINNDNDTDIDIIKIYKAKDYIVSQVSTIGERIDLLYDYPSIYADENSIVYITLNGEEITYESLVNNDVLSVYDGVTVDGKKVYNIIVSQKKISDVLSGEHYDDETDKHYYKINGNEYENTENFRTFVDTNTSQVKPEIGKEATFLLTHDGKIAGITDAKNGFSFGFPMKTYIDEDTEKVHMKLYTSGGDVEKYTFKEKVKFYNALNQDGVRVEANVVYNYLNNNPPAVPELVAYRLNEESEIVEFAVALDLSAPNDDAIPEDTELGIAGQTDYPLTKDFTNFGGFDAEGKLVINTVRSYQNIIDYVYTANGVTTLVYPTNASSKNNEKAYRRQGFSYQDEYFEGNVLTLYNVDAFYKPRLITLGAGVSITVGEESSAYMIAGVRRTLNDDNEECIELDYYIGNTLTSKKCSSDCVISQDAHHWYGKPNSINELKRGDIIQINQNNLGEINALRVLFKIDKPTPFGFEDPRQDIADDNKTIRNMSKLKILHGTIDSVTSGVVMVDMQSVYTHRQVWPIPTGFSVYGNTVYNLYNRKTGEVSVIKRNEMMKGDEVVVRRRYTYGVEFFILR